LRHSNKPKYGTITVLVMRDRGMWRRSQGHLAILRGFKAPEAEVPVTLQRRFTWFLPLLAAQVNSSWYRKPLTISQDDKTAGLGNPQLNSGGSG